MSLKNLYDKLNTLLQQKNQIEQEILKVKKEIEQLSPLSKEDKIKLFKSLFIGREDVYATYWISQDGTKKGYSPATYTFKGKDYIPINEDIIKKHLEGKIRLGTYAIINQVYTKFLVIDLDKQSFIEDARAIKIVCEELNLNPLFEISKSGNGIHIWLFFEKLIKASHARKLGDIIITKAMDIGFNIDMKSYDRMFPNQDFIAPDMLGNLIALPLHFKSRNENKTVFINLDTLQPYINQWEILQNVQKISELELLNIIKNNTLSNIAEETLMPWEIKQNKPLVFPKTIKVIFYDALYLEKQSLSQQLLNKLKRFASFLNPKFYKLQNLRKSTFNTPRIISLFEINEKYIILPRGLISKIIYFFKSNNTILEIEDKRFLKKIKLPPLKIKLKDEQKKAFEKVVKTDYCILIAPPGFGKTVVASAIIEKRSVNTLILVHKANLLHQWSERLKEYFNLDLKNIGMLGNKRNKLNFTIDIAMLQSLKNKPDIIKEYSQIIIDEVHHIPAISFELPIRNFKGKYILGLSATPKRKDGMHPIMFMQCGDIVYEAKPKNFKMHKLKIVESDFDTIEDDFTSIISELITDFKRNEQIINEIKLLKNRNILVLSDRVEHLNTLYHMLKDNNLNALLFHGSLSYKMQKEAKEKLSTSNIILSTTSYIGEGLDISHLDTIILTTPISYSQRLVQYLGRIGRNNQECIAVDFLDKNIPMLKSSFRKRLDGYKKMGYTQSNENLFFY